MKTIKAKLITGFALVLVLTVAVGGIGFYQIYDNSQKNERMIEVELEFSNSAINIQRLILQNRRYEKDLLLNAGNADKQRGYLERFEQASQRLRAEINQLRDLATKTGHVNEKERRALAGMLEDYDEYHDLFFEAAEVIREQGIGPVEGNRMLSEAKEAIYRAEEAIEDAELGNHVVSNSINELLEQSRLAEIQLAALTFAALIAGLGVSFLIFRAVETPLRRMITYTDKVSSGDLNATVDIPDHGEMGHLKASVQSMVAELKTRLGFADGILKGLTNPCLVVDRNERLTFLNQAYVDLYKLTGKPEDHLGKTMGELFYGDASKSTITGQAMQEQRSITNNEISSDLPDGSQIHVRFDVAPLYDLDGNLTGAFALMNDLTSIKNTLNQIEEKNRTIENAAGRANRVADQVASASEELSAQVEQSSRGANQQRENAASTATAMEEMNATVLEVAKNASSASELADQSRGRAQEGAEVVEMVVDTIKQVHENASELKVNMNELGKQAEGISKIMNVITDIADQTNLLALNAAIEAARAGEAGRGFAVVADEVRKLAEKTMTATTEVGDYISAIQSATQKNIASTDNATKAIDRSTELADQSGSALTEIVSLVEQTADQVRNIATAAEQQSAASEEVTRSTEEISVIADETSRAMSESNRAVQELSELAQELKLVIEDMQR